MVLTIVTLLNGLWEALPEIRSKMELLVPRNQTYVNEELVLLLIKQTIELYLDISSYGLCNLLLANFQNVCTILNPIKQYLQFCT
jgi:hypothetical protein